jgi:hypothetical protein
MIFLLRKRNPTVLGISPSGVGVNDETCGQGAAGSETLAGQGNREKKWKAIGFMRVQVYIL